MKKMVPTLVEVCDFCLKEFEENGKKLADDQIEVKVFELVHENMTRSLAECLLGGGEAFANLDG